MQRWDGLLKSTRDSINTIYLSITSEQLMGIHLIKKFIRYQTSNKTEKIFNGFKETSIFKRCRQRAF